MGIEGDVVSCLYEIVFDDNSLISGVPRFLNLKQEININSLQEISVKKKTNKKWKVKIS